MSYRNLVLDWESENNTLHYSFGIFEGFISFHKGLNFWYYYNGEPVTIMFSIPFVSFLMSFR